MILNIIVDKYVFVLAIFVLVIETIIYNVFSFSFYFALWYCSVKCWEIEGYIVVYSNKCIRFKLSKCFYKIFYEPYLIDVINHKISEVHH